MPDLTGDELLALAALAPLNPRLVPEAGDSGFTWCPSCGKAVDPYPDGRVPLCLSCTVAELGYGPADIAACVSYRVTMKRWLTLTDEQIADLAFRRTRRR